MNTKRQVFYSFHYKEDAFRAGQVRNIGVVEGNEPASDNDWEEVKSGGDSAIKKWIAKQMGYRSCTIVLVGEKTANRKWINYEIRESWKQGMGVVGIYIHGLKDASGETAPKGENPFDYIEMHDAEQSSSIKLSSVVQCYHPRGSDSKEKYGWIKDNLSELIEEAIGIRNKNEHISE